MTEAQLDAVAAAVGFALPAEYRRVAEACPFRPIGRDAVYWFYDDPAWVIGETLAPLADGGYDRAGWRDGYLTIGASPAGDPYVLDTAAPGRPVLLLCHETHRFEPAWPTFAAFVEHWLRAPAAVEEQRAEREAAEAAARRRLRRRVWAILAVAIGLPLAALVVLRLAR